MMAQFLFVHMLHGMLWGFFAFGGLFTESYPTLQPHEL